MSTLIQPPPPTNRKWWWVPATVAVAALVVGALIWLPSFLRSCGDGVVHAGDECVGVTDGSFSFDPELDGIMGSIQSTNADITDSGDRFVSIVVMSPMTVGDNGVSIATMSGIRHRLEGAHLAQLDANRADATPKIKLLVANPGIEFAHWGDAVAEIQERREPDNIVAVTGIAFSLGPAFDAVKELARLQLPVVGSTLTTDELPPLPEVLRVSPTASDHARAAADYLADRADRIMIIRDDNPDDSYGHALDAAFRQRFSTDPDKIVGLEHYDSSLGSVSNRFEGMNANICDNTPDTIYFAGRAAHALLFLDKLAERNCSEKPVRVVTADDMAYYRLADFPAEVALEKAGVSVLYTGLVHEQVWQTHPDLFSPTAVDLFTKDCSKEEVCYRALSNNSLEDFAAVMEHDAVLTAVTAIRRAATNNDTSVQPGEVLQEMKGLHGATAIKGASGTLSFDEDGLPISKPIPILQARVGQEPQYMGLVMTDPDWES